MVKIKGGAKIPGSGGANFEVVSSYPDTIPPCHSLVDKVKIKKDKIMVVIHTDNDGETSITERKIGE